MKERKIKILAGCRTNGVTDFQLGNICSDPECYSCSNFHKAFKEEVEKWEATIPPLDEKKTVVYDKPFTRESIREAVEYVFRNHEKPRE